MPAEDCFSSSLAPICFAILSDKARERTAALTKLHSILPGVVKQKDFSSEAAGKVLKSFLDWLQAEIRISRKSQTNNNAAVASVLKELKWIISLFDVNFPRINLSGILFELIDRLTDTLNFGNFPEVFFILNQQILSKSPYLKSLQTCKLTSRFNRLVTALYERSEEKESSIKSLIFLAISLPNSLKLEPLTYEMFHESFLKFISSCDNCGFLTSLLGAINSLLLDYFEHSQQYALHYFPFVLNWLKVKNNPFLFNKCLEFLLLSLDKLTESDLSLLANQLEKELDDPQNCPLYQIDPVTFCYEIIGNCPVTLPQLTRQMFLDLCYKLYVNIANVPLALFRILRYKDFNIQVNTTQNNNRISSDWSVLLQFHTRQSSIQFNSFSASKSSLNWYKLWFISCHPHEFPSVKIDHLDEFVLRSLKSSTFPLDTLGFDGFAAYCRLRFKNLWWTKTACETFKCFLDAVFEQNIIPSPSFLQCLLPNFEIVSFPFSTSDDPKALDCSLFLNRLRQLENCTNSLYSKSQECKEQTVETRIPLILPDPFFSLLKTMKTFTNSGRNSPIPSSESSRPVVNLCDFMAYLYDKDEAHSDDIINFICSHINNSLWLFELFSPLIAKRLPITDLLSFLIPKVQAEASEVDNDQNSTIKSNRDDFDDDFKMKSSEFEVNSSCPQLFHQSPACGVFTRLSLSLLNFYEAVTEEEKQILNDWKLFMAEFSYKTTLRNESISSPHTIAMLLRECHPFFNLPPIDFSKGIDSKLVLPSLHTISNKISSPEQLIPFFWIMFNSSASTKDLIVDWLLAVPIELFSKSRRLAKLIKMNTSPLITNEFFKKWVETSRPINSFPFEIFSNESPADFILKCPFLSIAIAKDSSAFNLTSIESRPFVHASALLEESAARFQSRKPVDFSPLQTDSESIQFVPFITALLSHGQFQPWPVVVASLQSLAKQFKLSAATDFSELFNPIHSLFILRGLSLQFASSKFLKTLFNHVPILSKYPHLLHFTLKLILARERQPYELADLEREFPKELSQIKKEAKMNIEADVQPTATASSDLEYNDFVSFVLRYGHSKLFSNNSKIIELLFDVLNLTNLTGSRVFPLESFETSVPSKIREDLKMLILPPGSKVICFNKREGNSEPTRFSENENYWKSATEIGFLCDLCKLLCSYNDETWASLLLNLLAGFETTEPRDSCGIGSMHLNGQFKYITQDTIDNVSFLQLVLPFLLDSINKKASYTIIPELIQNLIAGLNSLVPDCPVFSLIIKALHLIISKTPVGPNVVDTILRRFTFNTKIFKDLQRDATPSSTALSLYYFSLLKESPKLANSELNLDELEEILQHSSSPGNHEYLTIVKKRLSKFDDFEINWPETKGLSDKLSVNDTGDSCWLDRKWFDQSDFYQDNLLLKDFISASSNLGKLHSILIADYSVELPVGDEIFKMLRNCCISRKKLSNLNFKEILQVASEVKRLNFKGIGLLPLCSPKLEQVSRHLLADMSAKIHWQREEFEEALEISRESLKLFPSSVLPDESKALLLSRIGEWATVSKSERPSHILSQYFDKAMSLCENTSNLSPAALAQIHIKVARFLDEQYQQIKESEDFKNRSKLLEESRAALNAARNASSSSQQDRIQISLTTLRNQYELDMQEYSERKRSLNSFLTKAVENYISALSFGVTTENDQMAAISRLCALWFSNADFPSINESINSAVNTQPSSRKSLPLNLFLPLIYQLAARASYDRTEAHPSHFQRTLVRLLVQLTIQFPFNCIYQLLALRAGDGESVTKKRKLLSDSELTKDEADLRAAAASLVIDQSRRIPSLTSQISAIEILVDAYIELANAPPPGSITKNSLNGVIEFSSALKIKRLLYPLPTESPLRQIPIPTGPVDGETFAGFIDGYKLLGGINLPKCIEAVSCSGNRHAQLVKGRDDVRQDAVMEQVFLRVNKLLKAEEETRKRGLSVRTYRVIPLRPLVGLIEWVSDSIPLATFLTEAHERLRPGDLTASKCRELLKMEAERPGSTIQSKLNVLVKEIGQRFRPVLRYFFFEHFNVNGWWAAKQAYTRSMATASIVGWIVGLGDRHGMNILLDKKTGEIVHIDLNMIFEAGRTLRVPERVPFRMTPDCVDGLGPEGIGLDGPFKNHAIATLKVLRRERALIMMILEVFKYDPLQKWTGLAKVIENNTTKANETESVLLNTFGSTSDLITKEADRALMRIKEKLEGREEGVVLSEAGHVAFLIQTATDPELLCQMYVGWQAYF